MAKVIEAQMEELEAPVEHLIDSSEAKELSNFDSLKNHEKQGDLIAEVGVNTQSAPVAVVSNDNAVGSSHSIEDQYPLLELRRSVVKLVFQPTRERLRALLDLQTGKNWTSS